MKDELINHSYTVMEIERMRGALFNIIFPMFWRKNSQGLFYNSNRMHRSKGEEKIEMQLRTYLLAGIRPEELEAAAEEKRIASELQFLELTGTKYDRSKHGPFDDFE